MANLPTIDEAYTNLKNQLQALYADKSVLEDKILELRANVAGFQAAARLQAQLDALPTEEDNGSNDTDSTE